MLDGGFNRWKALGLPLTDTLPEMERRTFTAQERPRLRVEAEELLARIGERSSVIVDAREPAQYTGTIRRGDRGGHVPTAVNIWAKSLVNDDGTWKSDEELREVLEAGGVRADLPVVAYCNGGVTATGVLFALDRIGHESWANYDGSWNEWGSGRSCRLWKARNPARRPRLDIDDRTLVVPRGRLELPTARFSVVSSTN